MREKTTLIVWHTIEGHCPGCFKSLRDFMHYVIYKNGEIWCMVEDERYAYHAGHSMYGRDTGVSRFSIGIELEGYSKINAELPEAQKLSADSLRKYLQWKYCIPDSLNLIHPAVACFYPGDSGYYKRKKFYFTEYERGRKGDALQLALQGREQNNFPPGPTYDSSVDSGYMKPDKKLEKLLYGENHSKEELQMFKLQRERREDCIPFPLLPICGYEICYDRLEGEIFPKPKIPFSLALYIKEEKEFGMMVKNILKFLSE